MTAEHPFAPFIRTLGKGRQGARALSQGEAREAMHMILAGEVEPIQLGAFLMLLRVKEETAAEVAGFVQAVRAAQRLPSCLPRVDVDWPSYAGKRRQLPWYLLAALLLSENGISVFMHGMTRADERVYTPDALAALGLRPCDSLAEAAGALEARGFAYLAIEQLAPRMHEFIGLRSLLGLRSPAHTIVRMLNPFQAPLLMQGIFHPGFAAIHQQAAQLLGQPRAVVIKGEGGEVERDPDIPVTVRGVADGEFYEETWPALTAGGRHVKPERLDPGRLRAVWTGAAEDSYGEAAVIGTAALAIRALGRAATQAQALELARAWWLARSARAAA